MKTRRDFKGNIWRELLARAIERNGGYSRGYHERFALEWTVGIYVGVPSSEALLNPLRPEEGVWGTLKENWGVSREEFMQAVSSEALAEWREEWDSDSRKQSLWDDVREGMGEMLRGNVKGTTYGSVRPEIANRYGLGYYSPKLYSRLIGDESAYYPAKVKGWRIEGEFNNVPDFDATFEFHGRGGKHLCLASFEGKDIRGRSDELAEMIRTDHESWARGTYSNDWCQMLLAYIHQCDLMFTSEAASKEFLYQCTFRAADELHDLYEACVDEAKEAAEVQFWAERDVMTEGT
jgi:hypothetical protein